MKLKNISSDHTNKQVSIRTIERDRNQTKAEASKFFYLLAKDNHEYNFKLKITIDSLEDTLSDLKKEYKSASNIIAKLRIADSMLKHEKAVYEYYKFLPMTHQNLDQEYPRDNNDNTHQEDQELSGLECEPWAMEDYIQCQSCKRWFKNEAMIKIHNCLPEPIV